MKNLKFLKHLILAAVVVPTASIGVTYEQMNLQSLNMQTTNVDVTLPFANMFEIKVFGGPVTGSMQNYERYFVPQTLIVYPGGFGVYGNTGMNPITESLNGYDVGVQVRWYLPAPN